MLSYSRCCDFYRCPYLFQCHDEVVLDTPAIRLGSQIDMMMNMLMIKHLPQEQRYKKSVELGITEMMRRIVEGGDACEILNVPPMVKQWYIDFITSGVEVVDVQKYFEIPELDYRGYVDAVFDDGNGLIVVENKTTSRYYDGFFTSKKNSYQAVGYSMAVGTDRVKYQFFDTKTMAAYTPVSRMVTEADRKEFTEWVSHVRDNSTCFVKNKEWCSLNNCPIKEECWV